MRRSAGYQRAHLRAPYQERVLFGDEGFIHRARSVNISEGGILLSELPEFPSNERVPLLLRIPSYPHFRNFTLLKLQTFSAELFPAKIIRVQGQMVRRIGPTTDVDDVFRARFGIQFLHITEQDQKVIADYVSGFTGNLVYLQMLLDSWNTDEDIRQKTRALASILGYKGIVKVADLRQAVTQDYLSMQWL